MKVKTINKNKLIHEHRSVGLLLSFVGGAVDTYTYTHYQSFASAQTGNVVLAITQAVDGEWVQFFNKMISLFFFFIGVLTGKFLMLYFKKRGWPFWRMLILYVETAFFFFISIPIINQQEYLIMTSIAFIAAVQWISFDKINGRTYTSLFTTGNLKALAAHLHDYIANRDEESLEGVKHFSLVVGAFMLGVLSCALLNHIIFDQSIILVAFIFLYLSISQTILVNHFYRGDYK